MHDIHLLHHGPRAIGLSLFGLGPNLQPTRGLRKLKLLLDEHSFWASNRSYDQLRRLLFGSSVVISAWYGKRMVGFGRATGDGIFRAVLWDVVVPSDLHGKGIGKKVVKALLNSKKLKRVERIYLMTTNSADFYHQLEFKNVKTQKLLMRRLKDNTGSN